MMVADIDDSQILIDDDLLIHVVAEKRKQCLSSAFDGSYVSADNLILNESWFLRYEQVFMLWIEA